MNRSFLIIILPALAVGLGYIFMFHWLGFALEPFRFVGAAIVIIAAVILVQRRQRRTAIELGQDGVVETGGKVEIRSTVDDPVTDRGQPVAPLRDPRREIGKCALDGDAMLRTPARLADALDVAAGD